MGNQLQHERQAIIVFEHLCNFLFNAYGGKKLNPLLWTLGNSMRYYKRSTFTLQMEGTVMYPLAVMDIQVYLMGKGNAYILYFDHPTAFNFEDTTGAKRFGGEAFLVASGITVVSRTKPYF